MNSFGTNIRLCSLYESGILGTLIQPYCGQTFMRAANSGPERGGGGMRGFFAASSNIATSSSFSSLLPFAGVDGPEDGCLFFVQVYKR